MPDITFNLRCTSCGGSLQVPHDVASFACGFCGVEQQVQRQGGTVSLRGVTGAPSKAASGTDRTAAELALQRLGSELRAAQARVTDLNSRLERVHEDSQVIQRVSLETPPSTWVAVALVIEIVVLIVLFIWGINSHDPNLLRAIFITVGVGVATFVLFMIVHGVEEAAAAGSYKVRKAEADSLLHAELEGELAAAKANVLKLNRQIAENRAILDA